MTGAQTQIPDWARRMSPATLGLATFAILALELALIRWTGAQVRIFAYFANLVLIAVFLGMGLGVALGRKHPALFKWTFPTLFALAALLAFSDRIGLMDLGFPDPSISLWGADISRGGVGFLFAVGVVLGLFWLIAAVFLFAAIPVGWWFERMPPLRAYAVDLLGSLLGVLAMTAIAALHLPPLVWLAVGVLPLMLIHRGWWIGFGAAAIALAGWSQQGARFSPYNRIDVVADVGLPELPPQAGMPPEYRLSVNRDFHQYLLNLSDRAVAAGRENSVRPPVQAAYNLPFRVADRSARALAIGAGAGNDVAAALRLGFKHVTCVEIDPVILRLGRQLHPEQPYADPRVRLINNDARAYFEQNTADQYDVVCYGLVDSHAMFSAMSTLRLDNYLYTVEGIRSGWRHVAPGGLLSVSFSVAAGRWMVERLNNVITEATGRAPVIVAHGYNHGVTFLVGENLTPAKVQSRMAFPIEIPVGMLDIAPAARTPTDDWPFLYLRPGAVPYAYLVVIGLLLVTAACGVQRVFGKDLLTARRFDWPLFLMGAAFLLLETRMVTELSLLFGSTWVVNASVFAGVLVMALSANAFVMARPNADLRPWFAPLALSLLAIWHLGAGTLNQLPLLTRGILGGALFALPVFFAGVILSNLLRQASHVSSALGSNILGAVVGGCLEYLSMYAGLRKMTLLALALYLAAYLAIARQSQAAPEAIADSEAEALPSDAPPSG
ncbi:MAG: hypothetical protein CFK52_09395 [Chloracidobacterium sp. CP2_5A]|nr:MAG: hypothetical protein CFK52_09395 [Chloracidobacterium sp. CP2_5A]